ncbi:unnamed protein product, partial [Adineta ricciae]
SGNKIRSISPSAFLELSNYLEELTIEFDPDTIHQIPDAIQVNLINLRSLKLIDLNLSQLRNHTFSKFRKLESLSIIKSNIKSLESNAFHSLTNLRYLNLDQNQLNDSSWTALTKYLSHLETLSLSQNQFTSLKQTDISMLRSLDLSSNGLQYIDPNIFPSLEKLYLQNNELNSLQLTFLFGLKHLTELNLDFNRLTFLPEKIFQANIDLQDLSFQGNDLNYLTNYSFFGLSNLQHLNLARNRLQFSVNSRPFQHVPSLKVLNLDRNIQMNLTENLFRDLSSNLIELSLQNCNLTTMNYSLNFLKHLQRLKLSSNSLQELPNDFLSDTIVAIDLQRNSFRSVPNLPVENLIDIDLSSNQISTLNEDELRRYSKLKTIGLTGNPLNCNCHLSWIKQWLKMNYDRDLVKFLQWTCAQPMNLLGKQLINVDEHDMSCEENNPTVFTSTDALITSLEVTSSLSSPTNDLIIQDMIFNPNGMLVISWKYFAKRLPKYYHLKIFDESTQRLIFQSLISGQEDSIEIDLSPYVSNVPLSSLVCLNILQKKSCRNLVLQSNINTFQSASLVLSTSKPNNIDQLFYLLGGILLGAIFVCTILIIICYCRLCYGSKEHQSREKSSRPFYYHPLNVISYPQQQSNNTSECSLHSSIDTTNHLPNDPYHIYQQIPSIHNCQIHSINRTHVLV